jgi:hypothetical protein
MKFRRARFRTAAGWCFARTKRSSSRPTPAKAGGEPGPITTGGDHGSPLSRGRHRWAKCPLASLRQNAPRPPRPHAEEHRSATRAQPLPQPKCAAMRLEAWGRTIARPQPSRRASARSNSRSSFGVRAPQDEDEHRVLQSSPYKQPFSFPRRISAPGVCIVASLTPNRGVGGAPRNVRVLGGTPVRPAHDAAGQALARRLASHSASRRA